MAHTWFWWIVAGLLGHASANNGDDFANNLFTDLTPLLSLFGERVTMQFMSQAIGLADCVLLATAPLGIITIMVSAIRVGGPMWLKAIIGRARENLSTVELELMSSTSEEACELWNGRNIIRCQGSADIWQFICLYRPLTKRNNEDPGPHVQFKKLEEVMSTSEHDDGLVREKATSGPAYAYEKLKARLHRIFSFNLTKQMSSDHGDEEAPLPHGHVTNSCGSIDQANIKEITIITDGISDGSAPNLLLNCHDGVSREEMYLVAVLGILLQMSVIIFSGFITNYPPLLPWFRKDKDESVSGYAFPCAMLGTILLALGMFLCVLVVEQSTVVSSIEAVDQKTEMRIVWLQKNHVTNDQATSALSEDLLSVGGPVISLAGFAVQFVGFRGLHWSASIMQLGAVITMTVLRAWVRRGLAQAPASTKLTPDYELDWLALNLAEPIRARRSDRHDDDNNEKGRSPRVVDSSQKVSVLSGWDRHSGQFPVLQEIKEDVYKDGMSQHNSPAGTALGIRAGLGHLNIWRGSASEDANRLTKAIEVVADALLLQSPLSSFVWTLPVRHDREKGREARDTVSIPLKRSQEGKWVVDARKVEAVLSFWMHSIRSSSQERDGSGSDKGARRQREEGVEGPQAQGERETGIRLLGSCRNKEQIERDLSWWMPETTTTAGLFVIPNSPHYIQSQGISEQRVAGFAVPSRGIDESSQGDNTEEDEECRACQRAHTNEQGAVVDGSENHDHAGILAMRCDEPLERFLSRDLFFSFVMAAAQLLGISVPRANLERFGNYGLQSSSEDLPELKMDSDDLARIVQDLESAGWSADKDELYLDLIVPLSLHVRLEAVPCSVVDKAQKKAESFERRREWRNVLEVSVWLLKLGGRLDPQRDPSQPLSMVMCLDILRRMYVAQGAALDVMQRIMRDVAQRSSVPEYKHENFKDLSSAVDLLVQEFRRHRIGNASHLFRLIEIRGDEWNGPDGLDLLRKALRLEDLQLHPTTTTRRKHDQGAEGEAAEHFPPSFGMTEAHLVAIQGANSLVISDSITAVVGRGASVSRLKLWDSFGWTPLHYALARGTAVDDTLAANCIATDGIYRVQHVDFRGWTMLHYACQMANRASIGRLLSVQHDLEQLSTPGMDGVTPVHAAIKAGGALVVRMLRERGPLTRVSVCGSQNISGEEKRDVDRRLPSHWAAIYGSLAWSRVTRQDAHLQDAHGLNSMHLAVMYERRDVVEFLSQGDEDGSLKNRLSGHDFFSDRFSPLHIAVQRRSLAMANTLLDAGANIDVIDAQGETPLYKAAIRGDVEDTLFMLLDRGASHIGSTPDRHVFHAVMARGDSPLISHFIRHYQTADNKGAFARNAVGETPLHVAARRFSLQHDNMVMVCEGLLAISSDININARRDDGKTPLDIAVENAASEETIQDLEKMGAQTSSQLAQHSTSIQSLSTYDG